MWNLKVPGKQTPSPQFVPTSHDNLLPNQDWLIYSLPAGPISEIKWQRGGERRAEVFIYIGR